ncbi:MAG: alpha/beta fold hydrolase [Pseudomonadota bacterium]
MYPVEAFAALPRVEQPKLSPNGEYIAYLSALATGRRSLVAHPLSGMTQDNTLIVPHVKNLSIDTFRWANDERILITYSFYGANDLYRGDRNKQTRLVSTDLVGNAINVVKPSRDQQQKFRNSETSYALNQSEILHMLPKDPDHILLAIDDDMDFDTDVRKINVTTGKYDVIQFGRNGIYDWVTDTAGVPLIGYSTLEAKPALRIDKSKKEVWSEQAIYTLLEEGYRPFEVHEDGMSAYFWGNNEAGRSALARFSLADGTFMNWVYSSDQFDIQYVQRSDITNQIYGIGFIDTVSRQVVVGGLEKQIIEAVNGILPGAANRILSSDKSGRKFLIRSDVPRQVPTYYVLDLDRGALAPFARRYDGIEDVHVAPVTTQRIKMRDGLEIEVYITTPLGRGDGPLPAIMLPHGGPQSRDTADYDYLAQFFANRGYVVLQPNFRGSTGYGSAFAKLRDKAWGRGMQDDVTDTARWAAGEGLIDAKRTCIVGWSYGGYAALMGAVKTPDLFACAVSINGVIDLPMLWSSDGRKFIGGKEWRKSIGDNREDLADISPYGRAEEIEIPVLLIASKDDERVDYKHSMKMYKRLRKLKKTVEYVALKTGGHSIVVNKERFRFMTAMGKFVDTHLSENAGR